MANRFYGQKRIDDAEANRFTERLGLPTGWLDIPRTVTDIPESVSDLLANPSPASTQQKMPPAVEINTPGAKKLTAKTKTAGAQLASPPKADRADGPADPAGQTRAVIEQRDLAATAADDPSTQKPVHNDVSLPRRPSTVGAGLRNASHHGTARTASNKLGRFARYCTDSGSIDKDARR